MDYPILQNTPADKQLPPPNAVVLTLITVLWLAFACAFPLHRVQEARQQARAELQEALATETTDKAGVVAAFDHANHNVDAAASGPCLLLAVTVIFLTRQILLLRRKYHAAVLDAEAQRLPSGSTKNDEAG